MLTWSSANATSCSASDGWSGTKSVLGSEMTPALSNSTTFTLTCTGAGGSAIKSVTVAVTSLLRPDPPQAIQAAVGDGAITVSWQSLVGSYFQGHLVTSNVYVSSRPNIDPSSFVESTENKIVRGLSAMLPTVVTGLANGTRVYVVATDVADGVESPPSPEISLMPQTIPSLVEKVVALNDTGVDACADVTNLNQPCPVAALPNQDADVGRDADARNGVLVKVGFGRASFDFTKLDAAGAQLLNDAATWPCVRDNTTGLTWGVPGNSALMPPGDTYSWYQPDERVNGGNAGAQRGGVCALNSCDTNSLINALNAAALCSYRDWRLPTRRELLSLVDFSLSRTAFDPTVFPYQPGGFNAFYWTSTVNAASAGVGYGAWAVDVATGRLISYPKSGFIGVNLMPATALAVRSN
jgi:hypothetical protein